MKAAAPKRGGLCTDRTVAQKAGLEKDLVLEWYNDWGQIRGMEERVQSDSAT